MRTCKRGHALDYHNERLYAPYVARLGRRVPKRECLACKRDLQRVREHRRDPERAWIGQPLLTPGLISREEELAMLIASQARDLRSGAFQAPQIFGGRPVLSLGLTVRRDPDRRVQTLEDFLVADTPLWRFWRWVG